MGKVVDKKILTVSANPRELQVIPGGFSLPSTSIDREYSVNGKLTVNGDLNLTDGTLYVKGDLVVNGGIMGVGSVFVDGKVTVNGGTSVLSTNQSSGAALFASSDVKFQGQSAAGYLDSLIASYPASTLAARKATYSAVFNTYQTVATAPTSSVGIIADAATGLVSSASVNLHGSKSSNYFVNPIPGPSGLRALHAAPAPIPALITSIKDTLGPAYSGDAKAQKIVHALEEEAYACRQDLSATDFPANRIDPDYKVRTSGVVEELGTQTGGPYELDQPHYININWKRGTLGYKDGITGAAHDNTDSAEVALWDGTNRLPYPASGKVNGLGPSPFFKDDRQAWNQPWCDSAFPSFSPYFKDMTVDHQNRILTAPFTITDYLQAHFGASVSVSKVAQAKSDLLSEFRSAQKSFVLNHPADFSWLSRSAFQGLVYSGGNVTVDGEFEIQGSVLSQGDVSINAVGPCKLIYNQEYFRTRGAVGPVTPVSVQQI